MTTGTCKRPSRHPAAKASFNFFLFLHVLFAIAGILLIAISALLTFIAFMIFPDFFTRLAEYMRQPMKSAPQAGILPPA